MNVKEYIGRFIKSMQTIEITFNAQYNDSSDFYVVSKKIQAGLHGKLLNEDLLEEIKDRTVFGVTANDDILYIFLEDDDPENLI